MKNELQSNLTQANLHAAIAIGSDGRTVTEISTENVALNYYTNE